MKLELIQRLHPTTDERSHLVLLHGACMGAWTWENNFMPYFFARGFNVHAISLRNHGKSEHNGKLTSTSIIDYVEDLSSFIQTIQGNVFIIGHSMGGFILQHYLRYLTSNVKAAVLLCSAPNTGLWDLVGKLLLRYPGKFIHALIARSWMPVIQDRKRFKDLFFQRHTPEKWVDEVFKKVQNESFLAFLEMVFMKLPPKKPSELPIMIIGAENDSLISLSSTVKMAKSYDVEPVIIKNSSHMIMMEEEWENVASSINEFIQLNQSR